MLSRVPRPISPVRYHRESMRSFRRRACLRGVVTGFQVFGACPESMAPSLFTHES